MQLSNITFDFKKDNFYLAFSNKEQAVFRRFFYYLLIFNCFILFFCFVNKCCIFALFRLPDSVFVGLFGMFWVLFVLAIE